MNKYTIKNIGCDDITKFEIELNEEQLKTIIKFCELNNDNVECWCMPELYIYKQGEEQPINKIIEDMKNY